jgi:hypothetical protein
VPYAGRESLKSKEFAVAQSESVDAAELFSVAPGAIPYDEFKRQMAEMEAEGR